MVYFRGIISDMPLVVFFLSSHIEDNIALLGVHDLLGFLRRDVHIYRPLVIFFILPTGSQKQYCQKE